MKKLLIVVIVLALVPAGCILIKTADKTAPSVAVTSQAKAIGRKGSVTVDASEPSYGVRDLTVVLVQEGREIPLIDIHEPEGYWWKFWGKPDHAGKHLEIEIGKEKIPGLKAGPLTVRATATNDSWAGFGKGRMTSGEITLPVILVPPRLEVLSAQHYINQGGSECILYRVTGEAGTSGVQAGQYFFPGHPLPGSVSGVTSGANGASGANISGGSGETRFALFAFPYDLPASTVPILVAKDAAGNEAKASFAYKLFPRAFQNTTINVDDAFLNRVVPEILSNSPSITPQGDMVKDYLQINGNLRRENARTLIDLAAQSKPEFLWKGAFTQLGNSQVEASFADHRAYIYRGRTIDHQDHLGFDLAVTSHHPIDASNDGVVVLAHYFGIFGNAVVIDHGFGIMTLYAHLSSIDVNEGQPVTKGEVIGKSGATGLAGGDHLHFTFLLDGIPVNPAEWWDAHWIHDRINAKIGER